MAALQARDGYTGEHSVSVAQLAMSVHHALIELSSCQGTMFWPAAVNALLAELESGGSGDLRPA